MVGLDALSSSYLSFAVGQTIMGTREWDCGNLEKSPEDLTSLYSPLFSRYEWFYVSWLLATSVSSQESHQNQCCLLVCQRTVGLYGNLLSVRCVWSPDLGALTS